MAGESRRDLIYKMRVDTEQAKKEWKATEGTVRGFASHLRKLEQQQRAVDDAMTGLGQGMVVSGAAIGLGLGLAAKAAIEWESAWTGVAKVVDGSPEQMAALEEELRGLATTLPQTHAEIAGVAAAAGQLGIAREDIAQFTQTMVAMGVSTDLASEDAAMSMARLMNIMASAPDDVDNLGSAIVGLGNAGASTESEIVEMALRIAGAGKTVGMTEADVLAFSSALASVGVEAESGGSSISTAMIKISEAVNDGGDSLETFAEVAGVSADEFASKFRSDPATAIDMFVQGLGRIQDSGGNVFGVMEELGLSEIRLRDNLLRLAGAGDLLTQSLETGNQAWDENSALMEEAARRYGTTEAQIQIARNQLTDMGITLGEHLLPSINDFLAAGQGLFAWFNGLSEGTQLGIVQFGTIATVIGVVGGAALIAAPKLNQLSLALADMGTKRATMASNALRGLSNFMLGPWGIAIGAAVAIFGAFVAQQAEARGKVEQLTNTLDAQTGAITQTSKEWIAQQLAAEGATEIAKNLGLDIGTVVDAILGEEAALAQVNQAIEDHTEVQTLQSDHLGRTTEEVVVQTERSGELADVVEDLTGKLADAEQGHADQREALQNSTIATMDASGEALHLAEQLDITTGAAQAATEGFDNLDQQVRALIDSVFALNGAERDVEAGIDAVTEKLEENGATTSRNTEAGRENEQAIEDQIAAIAGLAITTAEQTGSTKAANGVLAEQRERLENVMRAAGFTEDQIDDYTDALDDVPGLIETTVDANFNVNVTRTERINQLISKDYIPPGFASGGLVGFPDGGLLSGPGTGTSDSMLIRASNGEFVVNAEATSRNRALLEAINSGQALATARQHVPAAPGGMGSMSAAAPPTVKVWFDFSNVGDDFAKAIKKTVRDNGNGIVQNTFGSI